MKFGYLLFVNDSTDVDYLKLAYALALSIKNTQKEGFDKVALVVDNRKKIDKLKSPWVFDQIIEWNHEKGWDGRSWMYDLSPWETTVCLDVDMLFLRDCSHWVEYFIETSDLYIANKSYTFRNEMVTSDFYRKAFTANKLPNLYSFYTFFRKNKYHVHEFFELAKTILKNPIDFSNVYLSESKPAVIGTDEAFALASKILDISDDIAYELEFPRVVHMKPMVQNFPWPANKWSDHLGFYFNKKAELKIGNYSQMDLMHYVEKDKITDEYINILEEIAWKK